jgi:hypothetical protein
MVATGEWRGLEVAIKTLLFQGIDMENETSLVASEAAIASSLVHRNVVATYSHDVCSVAGSATELGIYKFYLIQVGGDLVMIS